MIHLSYIRIVFLHVSTGADPVLSDVHKKYGCSLKCKKFVKFLI